MRATLFCRKVKKDKRLNRKLPAPRDFDTATIPAWCVARPGDVVVYGDRRATRFIALRPGMYTNCPSKRSRYIMLNCMQYRVEWI